MIEWRECLFGPGIPVCTWIQHGVIAATVVAAAGMAWPLAVIPAALAVIAGFVYRELQGPDKATLPWYRRLFNGTDRTMDWVVPLIVAMFVAFEFLYTWR